MSHENLLQLVVDFLHTIFPAATASVAPPGRPSWLADEPEHEAGPTPPGGAAPAEPWQSPSVVDPSPTEPVTVTDHADTAPTEAEVIEANTGTVTHPGTVATV